MNFVFLKMSSAITGGSCHKYDFCHDKCVKYIFVESDGKMVMTLYTIYFGEYVYCGSGRVGRQKGYGYDPLSV